MNAEHSSTHRRWRDLHRLLHDLVDLHDQLVATMQRKLGAMRRSATAEMTRCVQRESDLTKSIEQRVSLRRNLMTHVARDLGINPTAARTMSLKELLPHVTAPWAERLGTVGDRLRSVLAEAATTNARCARLAGGMLTHQRAVLGCATGQESSRTVYHPDGRLPASVQPRMIDAMG
jgi:hypothetical protein